MLYICVKIYRFRCQKCKKKPWRSSNTTVIWRARWETGVVQVRIEKQGCRRCESMCYGSLADDEQIVFAVSWLIQWMLKNFYGIENENDNDSDELDEHDDSRGPHDVERCDAGKKGTCRRCNAMKQQNSNATN